MEGMKQFFLNLGAYAGPIIILLAEILIAGILLGCFALLSRKRKEKRREWEGEHLYYTAISQGQQEVHVLIRREDFCPIFITDNFENMMHIDKERFLGDVEVLNGMTDRKTGKEFWSSYGSWDGKSVLNREFRVNGREQWLGLSVSRLSDQKHDLFVFRDITEEKERFKELEQRLQEAEDASKYKTTFLSKMSHEIRTPMNGIIGMMALAQSQLKEDSPAKPYLCKAEEVSQYMLSLINDILDMSRIEAGKIELEEKAFDLRELGDKLRVMFQKNVEAKGIHFALEFVDFDVNFVIGDELRISQILINFLSNSVKFTSEGEIRVTFRQMLKEDGRIDLMVRVHDTGMGMEPEFISRIFRPFEQESADIIKKYGGSGLGMAIADQMVRLMGGEIVIDSMPGQGSDFMVFLNLPIADEQEAVAKDEEEAAQTEDSEDFSYEGLNILMAEDNEMNAEIAVGILEMKGAQVDVAANGREAVEKFASNPPGHYDLILMDIQMPEMDGREATKTIRSMQRPDAKEILIFALSADAFVEDRRYSAEIGMDGHFAKPIDFEAMRVSIGRIMKERKQI